MPRQTKTVVAVTGGIGSGKSVVCRILRMLGYDVFDCDSEAKALMDADCAIHERLNKEIDCDIVRDGIIDRSRLAGIVFADSGKLAILNSIVHGAVRRRIEQWKSSCSSSPVFVETAILFQSGLNEVVDAELRVTAPEDIRIGRVMARNSISRQAVEARIESQRHTPLPGAVIPPLFTICNDGVAPVLPQTEEILSQIS